MKNKLEGGVYGFVVGMAAMLLMQSVITKPDRWFIWHDETHRSATLIDSHIRTVVIADLGDPDGFCVLEEGTVRYQWGARKEECHIEDMPGTDLRPRLRQRIYGDSEP